MTKRAKQLKEKMMYWQIKVRLLITRKRWIQECMFVKYVDKISEKFPVGGGGAGGPQLTCSPSNLE